MLSMLSDILLRTTSSWDVVRLYRGTFGVGFHARVAVPFMWVMDAVFKRASVLLVLPVQSSLLPFVFAQLEKAGCMVI